MPLLLLFTTGQTGPREGQPRAQSPGHSQGPGAQESSGWATPAPRDTPHRIRNTTHPPGWGDTERQDLTPRWRDAAGRPPQEQFEVSQETDPALSLDRQSHCLILTPRNRKAQKPAEKFTTASPRTATARKQPGRPSVGDRWTNCVPSRQWNVSALRTEELWSREDTWNLTRM